MRAHELTLNSIKEEMKPKNQVFRVSDFLTNEEKARIKLAREEKKAQQKRIFDEIDAYSAEILARFGYDAWIAWRSGDIAANKMAKMVLAERARDKMSLLGLESLILSAVAGANNPTKHGRPPKSLKNAINILKSEQRAAKGLRNG